LTFVIAEEVRRLRRSGVAVTEIARRYSVAPSSISAVLKMHVYVPEGVIAVGLERLERAVLREIAQEERVSDEQLAAELIRKGLDRRTLGQG
jgi:hypothetical protein